MFSRATMATWKLNEDSLSLGRQRLFDVLAHQQQNLWLGVALALLLHEQLREIDFATRLPAARDVVEAKLPLPA
jgi:hypothetical protein